MTHGTHAIDTTDLAVTAAFAIATSVITALAAPLVFAAAVTALSWGLWVWIAILVAIGLLSFFIVSPKSPETSAGEPPTPFPPADDDGERPA